MAEDVFDKGSEDARAANLALNGATEEEVAFLLTRRVELNALTSDQLVAFVERKLQENGVGKVVPKKAELVEAYRQFQNGERIRKLVEAEIAKPNGVAVPADLEKRVRAYLKQHPPSRGMPPFATSRRADLRSKPGAHSSNRGSGAESGRRFCSSASRRCRSRGAVCDISSLVVRENGNLRFSKRRRRRHLSSAAIALRLLRTSRRE